MSTGETPMYGVAIITRGIVISGAASRGRSLYELQPKNRINTIKI
jgi:hypothetical protein